MSKRLVLFSQPSPEIFERLKSDLFPDFLKNKLFAYMPSDGSDVNSNNKYTPAWQQFAQKTGCKFIYIDNSKRGAEAGKEAKKLLSSDILMITGGNTFKLLSHLRKSALDKAIVNFWQKENIVLAGFSAGALVLTPSIRIAKTGDHNVEELSDLTGLNIQETKQW